MLQDYLEITSKLCQLPFHMEVLHALVRSFHLVGVWCFYFQHANYTCTLNNFPLALEARRQLTRTTEELCFYLKDVRTALRVLGSMYIAFCASFEQTFDVALALSARLIQMLQVCVCFVVSIICCVRVYVSFEGIDARMFLNEPVTWTWIIESSLHCPHVIAVQPSTTRSSLFSLSLNSFPIDSFFVIPFIFNCFYFYWFILLIIDSFSLLTASIDWLILSLSINQFLLWMTLSMDKSISCILN